MLPSPTLSFTIPSIYDSSSLECRIYHPLCLAPTSSSQLLPWRKKAAIVAHPYAPLGGSYDDAVVDLVASTILERGFCCGDFQFSWCGFFQRTYFMVLYSRTKGLYLFSCFMVTYLHHLDVPSSARRPPFTQSEPELHDLTPVPSQNVLEPAYDTIPGGPSSTGSGIESFDSKPLLLLAGYSYGSLITTNLEPSHLSMLNPFQQPISGSPYADIRSRARFLATQQNEVIETAFSLLRVGNHRRGQSIQSGEQITNHKSRLSSSGMRMGGDEDIRRASHDMHGSGVKFVVHNGSPRRVQSYNLTATQDQDGDPNLKNAEKHPQESQDNTADILGHDIKIAYLLVSPLPPDGVINSLASIGSLRPAFLFGKQRHKTENDIKFTIDPTLVIYGAGDLLVHAKTFERWADKLSSICKSRDSEHRVAFRCEEIAHGEHFWRSPQAARELRESIRSFLLEISA
ncbi:hypothetical protein EYC84_007116 [Monilinia fructicola]|uniref:AB hydrolase-1 domain-containing protein n=1 Tax=Monilinia fructicola TaxID=38448 RepID=A0A5M9K9N4_MONFR|nr:hypothetical protein EYC84_007116 [Monilinia fructicola]